MPRLSPVSWRELVSRLHALDFEGPLQGGKHPYMVKRDLVLTIPNPHRAMAQDAIAGWIAVAQKHGEPVPEEHEHPQTIVVDVAA